MNRFNRQWLTLSDPLPASHEFYMTHDREYYSGYLAFQSLHPVQLMTLYEALEYERYKNGRLRKKYHEMKQRCFSLKRAMAKAIGEAIGHSYNDGYYKCMREFQDTLKFMSESYDGNDAIQIMLRDIADKLKEDTQ